MKYNLNYCKSSLTNKSCSLIRFLTFYLLITNKLFAYNYVMILGLENYFMFRLMPGIILLPEEDAKKCSIMHVFTYM